MEIIRYKSADINKQIESIFSSYGKKNRQSCTRITLKPKMATQMESHPEIEHWVIIQGRAKVSVDHSTVVLFPGDVIKILPGESHQIVNDSSDADLIFVSIYEINEEELALNCTQNVSNHKKTHLVISSYPTPNGDLHLGHLGGPLLPSDVLHRLNILKGERSYLFTGTLGHQNYVDIISKQNNVPFYTFAEEITESIKASLKKTKIYPTYFSPPRPDEDFIKLNHDILQSLIDGNLVTRIESKLFYSESKNKVLSEGELAGICPYCRHTANGNECEGCGSFHDDHDLLEPKNAMYPEENSISTIKKKRFYIDLELFRDELESYLASLTMSTPLRRSVIQMMSRKLPKVPLTHYKDTGIRCTLGDEGEMFNSTLEHLTKILYCFSKTGVTNDQKENYHISVFFGIDNVFYKVILLPTLLIATGNKNLLPHSFYMNKFMLLEGEKFSTSRNHAIWVKDIAPSKVEYIRLYLAFKQPILSERNYQVSEMEEFTQDFYDKGLERLMSIAKSSMQYHKFTTVPEPGEWNSEHATFFSKIKFHHQLISQFLSTDNGNFSCRSAVIEIKSLIHSTLIFAAAMSENNEHYLMRNTRTDLSLLFCSLGVIYAFLIPILGGPSKHLMQLKIDQETLEHIYDIGPVFLKNLSTIDNLNPSLL